MMSPNFSSAAPFIVLLVSGFAYTQTATCTGWKTFNVANQGGTQAYGINSYGTVVGGTVGKYGTTTPAPAFVRNPSGRISTFRYQNQYTTFTRRNARNVTVGYYEDSSSHYHGIVVYRSKVVTINYPKASDTFPLGINYAGTIVGYYTAPGSIHVHGFELKNKKFTTIQFPKSVNTVVESINDSGVMIGSEWPGSGVYEGFVLAGGTFVTLKDSKATGATLPYDINNAGTIVGDYFAGVNPQSFMYSKRTFKDIVVPNATQANTHGVNGNNYVTGEAYPSNGSSYDFIAHCQ
jgi:hypothetical protein